MWMLIWYLINIICDISVIFGIAMCPNWMSPIEVLWYAICGIWYLVFDRYDFYDKCDLCDTCDIWNVDTFIHIRCWMMIRTWAQRIHSIYLPSERTTKVCNLKFFDKSASYFFFLFFSFFFYIHFFSGNFIIIIMIILFYLSCNFLLLFSHNTRRKR